MDPEALDRKLASCIKPDEESERTPVYAVVAIMCSTEQGAVDPLVEILELRRKYQEKDFPLWFTATVLGANTSPPWFKKSQTRMSPLSETGKISLCLCRYCCLTHSDSWKIMEKQTALLSIRTSLSFCLLYSLLLSDRLLDQATSRILLVDSVIVTAVCGIS